MGAGLCGSGKKKQVEPENLFIKFGDGKNFVNPEVRCEYVGNKFAVEIQESRMTLQQVIDEILAFSRSIREDPQMHKLSWVALHLCLGMCYINGCQDKMLVRNLLREVLPMSRGIDAGFFHRDVCALAEEGRTLNKTQKDLLAKANYYLKFCAGFNVNLKRDELGRKIYGVRKKVVPDSAMYFDLPLGHHTFDEGNAPTEITTCIMDAVDKMRPHAVLLYLRHGASAHGPPLQYILKVLSNIKTLQEKMITLDPVQAIEMYKESLTYCMRTVTTLKLRFDSHMATDVDAPEDVYFVMKRVTEYLKPDMWSEPPSLKHLARCAIRQQLTKTDHLPDGVYQLDFSEALQKYIDIRA